MKSKASIVIFTAIIILLVTIAGCICTGNGGQTPAASPTTHAPTATPVPKVGDQIVVNVMPDLAHVHWYEYHIVPSGKPVAILDTFTTEGSDVVESWNFSTSFQGQQADLATGTVAYPSMGASGVTIAYLNPANHSQILGGNITTYYGGRQFDSVDVRNYPNILGLLTLLDLTNSTYVGQRNVTYGGVEPVSVPAGNYTASKYLYNGTLNLTVYMANDVPVPVKVHAISTEGTIYDVELKGWG